MEVGIRFAVFFGLFVFLGLMLQSRLPEKYKWSGPVIAGAAILVIYVLLRLTGVVSE